MSKIYHVAIAEVVILLWSSYLSAQTQVPKPTAATIGAPSRVRDAEISDQSPQEVPIFKERANLVMVPVVVRDKKGKAIGSLKRGDFRIFDDGKLQKITTFSMKINSAGKRAHGSPALGQASTGNAPGLPPRHYFAYLFDDVHLKAGDLIQVREAAEKHLASGMEAGDRAAVFTTSGEVTTKFTGDAEELSRAMNKIKPGFTAGGTQCPYMNYYLAKRILYEFGSDGKFLSGQTPAWDAATLDTLSCLFHTSSGSFAPNTGPGAAQDAPGNIIGEARTQAQLAARREVESGDENTRRSLLAVRLAVRRLAAMPGSRTLILVSPGFLTGRDHSDQETIVDLAVKQKVVVNALDARGLYTGITGADNTGGPSSPDVRQMESTYLRQAVLQQSSVLAELAYGTGGEFFRDSNNLTGGFDQLAALPEYIYELGFRPEDLKHPGRYHRLKVVLIHRHGWSLQTRRGYSEGPAAATTGEQISEELEQALFSGDQVQKFPIALKVGYSTEAGVHPELTVTTHIDADEINLRRVNSTSVDSLTLVCGLFDINGNYLQGKKMEISLHLRDRVLKQMAEGMNIKTGFDVPPGVYRVRVVVRDSGTGLLSTASRWSMIQ
ncbi:MAG TPA: VWA domain-containing protein [Acidobacteriaceae bacterium]|nr:VWA domain-containing protein [Acidobacteriaceae bacterium]